MTQNLQKEVNMTTEMKSRAIEQHYQRIREGNPNSEIYEGGLMISLGILPKQQGPLSKQDKAKVSDQSTMTDKDSICPRNKSIPRLV